MKARSSDLMLFFFSFLSIATASLQAQPCSSITFQPRTEIPSACSAMTMTMRHDIDGLPYLYIAQKEGGLVIADVSDVLHPQIVATIPISMLQGLHVMNCTQDRRYLYLALGNHFTGSQSPGFAIVDITTPQSPMLLSVWKDTFDHGGCGHVAVEGNRAYVAAMQRGVHCFDISSKNKPQLLGSYTPSFDFPDVKYDSAKINARSMVVQNSFVYLCFDAGGFRLLDFRDPAHARECGRYSNPALNGHPRAYNNLALHDSLAYIAVDYCGVEILNVADSSNIRLVGWWNPWNCHTSGLNWFTSPGHANEIILVNNCKKLYLSTGKSDMYVVDVHDPAHPDSCANYGGVDNNLGTWGIDLYEERLYLSYICALIPFSSNWTGVKIITTTPCGVNPVENPLPDQGLTVYVDSRQRSVHVRTHDTNNSRTIRLLDILGSEIRDVEWSSSTHEYVLDCSHINSGVYVIQIIANSQTDNRLIAIP